MKFQTMSPLISAVRNVKTTIIRPGTEITREQIQLLEEYTQLRTDYVRQEHWPIHSTGIDVDAYDVAANSHYVIAYGKGRVVAGMRVTKISSLLGSLSYSMWQFANDRKRFDEQLEMKTELLERLERDELWDVTRLIAETSVAGDHDAKTKAYSRVGLLKVMSAGVTTGGDHPEVAWIFTTTPRMLRFMQKSSIETSVLASGKISESDEYEAVLCVAFPNQIIHELKRLNPAVHSIAKQVIKRHGRIK